MIYSIIHTYNTIETIEKCLLSLDGKVDYILVIDGPRWIGMNYEGINSTDGTIEFVQDFKSKASSNVRLILLTEPLFEYQCRNFGFSLVPEGEWILCIDSDEYIERWKLTEPFTERGYHLYYVDRSRLCLIRKTKGLRFTRNPHYGLMDENGFIDYTKFKTYEGITIRHHQEYMNMKRRIASKEYQTWLLHNNYIF